MARSFTTGRVRSSRLTGFGAVAVALTAITMGACGPSDPFRVFVPGTTDQAVDSIAVLPATTVATELGQEIEFDAFPMDASGEELDVTVTWRSTDITVATVDRFGVARVFAEGQTEIVATAGDATGSAVLTVIPNLDPGSP